MVKRKSFLLQCKFTIPCPEFWFLFLLLIYEKRKKSTYAYRTGKNGSINSVPEIIFYSYHKNQKYYVYIGSWSTIGVWRKCNIFIWISRSLNWNCRLISWDKVYAMVAKCVKLFFFQETNDKIFESYELKFLCWSYNTKAKIVWKKSWDVLQEKVLEVGKQKLCV